MNLNRKHLLFAAIMAIAVFGAAGTVQAGPFGNHPALRGDAAPAPSGIDPNQFIVAHPAGLALRPGHANHEHPAVVARREAEHAALDPNLFIVQPPATVRWVSGEDASTRVAVSQR